MKGYICDRCGAPAPKPTKLTYLLALPDKIFEAQGADLCPRCSDSVESLFNDRIHTAKADPKVFTTAPTGPIHRSQVPEK
ncbi:MAG: hypothetical protein RQ731_08070 [Anaerosomatales bacterium]|nr:hypothetical protein [Anaerosomatales bacterium]